MSNSTCISIYEICANCLFQVSSSAVNVQFPTRFKSYQNSHIRHYNGSVQVDVVLIRQVDRETSRGVCHGAVRVEADTGVDKLFSGNERNFDKPGFIPLSRSGGLHGIKYVRGDLRPCLIRPRERDETTRNTLSAS